MPILGDEVNQNGLIYVGGVIDVTQDLTLMGWFNVFSEDGDSSQYCFQLYNDDSQSTEDLGVLRSNGGDRLSLRHESTTTQGGIGSWDVDSGWNFICMTYNADGDNLIGYINMVEEVNVGSIDTSAWSSPANQTCVVIHQSTSTGGAFRGSDIAAAYCMGYQALLTPAEMTAQMVHGGRAFRRNDLKFDLPLFGSYTDQWLQDHSGNGADFSNLAVTNDVVAYHDNPMPPVPYHPYRRRRQVTAAVTPGDFNPIVPSIRRQSYQRIKRM